MPERNERERETLIFQTPEQAAQWQEHVGEKLEQSRSPGVNRPREIVGEQLTKEFQLHGETAVGLGMPWEHTHEEHQEAQSLVDMAFAQDLPVALRRAAKSPHYPRNLDLFHDVLTGEMYQLLLQHKINKQPFPIAAVGLLVVIGVIFVICLLFLLS